MNLIVEITSKAATLAPEQQREALELIEKLSAANRAAPRKTRKDETTRLPLKGATARPGKKSVSAEEIQAARREMWGKFYDEDEQR